MKGWDDNYVDNHRAPIHEEYNRDSGWCAITDAAKPETPVALDLRGTLLLLLLWLEVERVLGALCRYRQRPCRSAQS
jgi:hypothetical protein